MSRREDIDEIERVDASLNGQPLTYKIMVKSFLHALELYRKNIKHTEIKI